MSAAVQTRHAVTYIASAGGLRISVFEAGGDVGEMIAGRVDKYAAAGAVVFQVLLPLD